jgi:DNA-binding CsgD family transcriptional regulator
VDGNGDQRRAGTIATGGASQGSEARKLGTNRALAEDELSPRQVDILRLLADGESNKSIARIIGIGENTVKRHVSIIYRKLRVSNRAAAAAAYVAYLTSEQPGVRVTQRRIAVLPTKVGIPQDAGYRVRCQSLGGQPSAQTELPP